MQAVPLKAVRLDDGFWSVYQELVREVVIPYQWDALNDQIPGAEPSHAVRNMKIAARLETGTFGGFVFQDSDLMKWIEAAGYSLAHCPDTALEAHVDELVSYMQKAQQPDGYLDTFYIINGLSKRFTNLQDCHELYCLGHMIEGAVAYAEATGKKDFLAVACRFADLVDQTFGTEEGKLKGYDGHEEVELALVKLYDATGNQRYLDLAAYFINQRGKEPSFFMEEWLQRGRIGHWNPVPADSMMDLRYFQAHLPVREQKEAIGHAVRAVYLYTGMAAIARKTGDDSLVAACRTLWRNIVDKQLYITGGIGQTHHGEAFTFDYDLPNDTVYSETCAAIGLIFFAHEMLQIEPHSEYADVMEQALYNTVLAGMAKDGKHFFYVNPLEAWPQASGLNPGKRHVKPERQAWFGCSCCPPNVARLLAGLGKYVYSQDRDDIYVHLYLGGQADCGHLRLSQRSGFPWYGNVEIQVEAKESKSSAIYLRMPAWCGQPRIWVNSQPVADVAQNNAHHGYCRLERVWQSGDVIRAEFPMTARMVRAHANVRANAGKAAIVRGPLVYCAEEADNGANIPGLRFCKEAVIEEAFEPDTLDGVMVLQTKGARDTAGGPALYFAVDDDSYTEADIRLVPYFAWGNREVGEMAVWLPLLQ